MSDTPPHTSKGTILIVDDVPNNLRLLMGILTDQGYTVRPAPDGNLALNFARSNPPDLMLLDIKMPDMDGYEVCTRLKADEATRDIPVVFLSALNDVADKIKGFDLGGVDYITKPFQTKEVLARVATHINVRHLQQALQENNAQLQQEIVQRQQAEEELLRLNQQLREANANKDKFFSIIAHDLRSPFNWFLGFTELIIERIEHYSKGEIKEMIGEVQTGLEKLYAMIQNLLAWSRLQRGLMELQPRNFKLYTLAEQIAAFYTPGTEQKQISIKNEISPDMEVYADSGMVSTILRNLVSNALKFTEHGGTIDISAHSDEQAVEVRVSDTGVGMAQEEIAQLFRIDVKQTQTGTDGEEGTGLGLMLCKELVEKHHGRIWVESEPGEGTTFHFTLPHEHVIQNAL